MLILAVVPNTAKTWKKLLETRGLRFFGKYSYALYVFHPAVASLMPHVTLFPVSMIRANDWANACLVVLTTIGVALISWNLLEKRFLSMKKFFEPRRSIPAQSGMQEGAAAGA